LNFAEEGEERRGRETRGFVEGRGRGDLRSEDRKKGKRWEREVFPEPWGIVISVVHRKRRQSTSTTVRRGREKKRRIVRLCREGARLV